MTVLIHDIHRELPNLPQWVYVLRADVVFILKVDDVIRSTHGGDIGNQTGENTPDFTDGSGAVEHGGRPVVEVRIEFVDTNVNMLIRGLCVNVRGQEFRLDDVLEWNFQVAGESVRSRLTIRVDGDGVVLVIEIGNHVTIRLD